MQKERVNSNNFSVRGLLKFNNKSMLIINARKATAAKACERIWAYILKNKKYH
jgi:hypothetical protein